MGAAPQLWQAVWPRFGRVFPIELALSLVIMVIAWSAVTLSAAPAVFKARFAEAWLASTPGRYEVMERLVLGTQAETGAPDEQRKLSRYVASRRIAGSTVTLAGDIPGHGAYEMSFYPAVADEGVVAVWHCGRSNLPEQLVPSPCRSRKGS